MPNVKVVVYLSLSSFEFLITFLVYDFPANKQMLEIYVFGILSTKIFYFRSK